LTTPPSTHPFIPPCADRKGRSPDSSDDRSPGYRRAWTRSDRGQPAELTDDERTAILGGTAATLIPRLADLRPQGQTAAQLDVR
jgi:hypothetical protein